MSTLRLTHAADAILLAIRKGGEKATVNRCADDIPEDKRPVDAFTQDELLSGLLFLERMGLVKKAEGATAELER